MTPWRKTPRRWGLLLLCFCGWMSWTGAQNLMAPDEARAAFVVNFCRYTTWPTSAQTASPSLVVGVWGDQALFEAIQAYSGKEIQGRRVVVRLIHSAEAAQRCDAIYLASGADSQSSLQQIRQRPILTIGETEGFMDRGGIIRLRRQETRMMFDVNLTEAKKSGLSISSHVLGLAQQVRGTR